MKQNFRTIGSLVAICAMIVMAASCKKDNLREDVAQLISGVERTINASAAIPQGADKAYLDETDGRKVKWESGDAINVNGTNLSLTSIRSDATSATFEGTTYAIPSGGNEIYWAVYPTTLAGAASGSTIPSNFTANQLTVTLPDTQIVNTANSALRGNTYMAAYASVEAGTEHVSFDMRNIGTVLELNLTPRCSNYSRVDSIVFSSSNASLAGSFAVSNSSTNPTITSTAGSNKLVVKFMNGSNKYIDITGGKKVRVILPPLASKNLNMKIYGNANYMEKNAASVTLARNKYYSSAINFDVLSNVNTELPGFSVAPGKRVLFSPGNLQWSATNGGTTATTHSVAGGGTAAGTWRFAEHQWDYVGDATLGTVYGVGGDPSVKCNNANIGQNYQGWIDHFGWGTSGYHDANDSWNTNYYPYSNAANGSTTNGYGPSPSMTDPNLVGTSANYDWGVYNAIYNPTTNTTDPAGTWRTLTKDEWTYLINTRNVNVNCGSKKMYSGASVNGVNGLVILPDNWNPALCPSFNYAWADYTHNTFDETTTPKWSEMEAAGCIFLPAAGNRWGSNVQSINAQFSYYSSTYSNFNDAYRFHVANGVLNVGNIIFRARGNAVRLVKDVQ